MWYNTNIYTTIQNILRFKFQIRLIALVSIPHGTVPQFSALTNGTAGIICELLVVGILRPLIRRRLSYFYYRSWRKGYHFSAIQILEQFGCTTLESDANSLDEACRFDCSSSWSRHDAHFIHGLRRQSFNYRPSTWRRRLLRRCPFHAAYTMITTRTVND